MRSNNFIEGIRTEYKEYSISNIKYENSDLFLKRIDRSSWLFAVMSIITNLYIFIVAGSILWKEPSIRPGNIACIEFYLLTWIPWWIFYIYCGISLIRLTKLTIEGGKNQIMFIKRFAISTTFCGYLIILMMVLPSKIFYSLKVISSFFTIIVWLSSFFLLLGRSSLYKIPPNQPITKIEYFFFYYLTFLFSFFIVQSKPVEWMLNSTGFFQQLVGYYAYGLLIDSASLMLLIFPLFIYILTIVSPIEYGLNYVLLGKRIFKNTQV